MRKIKPNTTWIIFYLPLLPAIFLVNGIVKGDKILILWSLVTLIILLLIVAGFIYQEMKRKRDFKKTKPGRLG